VVVIVAAVVVTRGRCASWSRNDFRETGRVLFTLSTETDLFTGSTVAVAVKVGFIGSTTAGRVVFTGSTATPEVWASAAGVAAAIIAIALNNVREETIFD